MTYITTFRLHCKTAEVMDRFFYECQCITLKKMLMGLIHIFIFSLPLFAEATSPFSTFIYVYKSLIDVQTTRFTGSGAQMIYSQLMQK